MLIVLYGSLAKIGDESRKFFEKHGYELVEKYNYAPDKVRLRARNRPRKLVSKEEFFEKTDSLFRYDLDGLYVGFNQEQILDAVGNITNKLLTLSTPDVGFLRKIKEVYDDAVELIYCYVDKTTLEEIVCHMNNLDQEEEACRLRTGEAVRTQYALNSDLFDAVVIYGGEESEFNLENLSKQYQSIIRAIEDTDEKGQVSSYDVFLLYAKNDAAIVDVIRKQLVESSLRVF